VNAYEGWQKSTFSGGGDGANCLEVAFGRPHGLVLRESDEPRHMLTASPSAFAALIRHAKGAEVGR
jgi:uncharacterized protein DUF397